MLKRYHALQPCSPFSCNNLVFSNYESTRGNKLSFRILALKKEVRSIYKEKKKEEKTKYDQIKTVFKGNVFNDYYEYICNHPQEN